MGLSCLKLGTDNDLVFEANNFVVTNGTDYLAQKIKSTLQAFYGEWWLDVEVGVPYMTDILGQKTDLDIIRNIFTATILAIPYVLSIETLDIELLSSRTLTVAFEVRCVGEDELVAGEITI